MLVLNLWDEEQTGLMFLFHICDEEEEDERRLLSSAKNRQPNSSHSLWSHQAPPPVNHTNQRQMFPSSSKQPSGSFTASGNHPEPESQAQTPRSRPLNAQPPRADHTY